MTSPNQEVYDQARETQREVAAWAYQLDARLKRISDTILPSAPYLLEVQSNYRVGQQQINDWRRGCPFEPHEEQLQYMTFYPHQTDGSVARVVGGWDDGKGNYKPIEENSSGTTSPLPGQSAKKKISLLDYKKKSAGQPITETPPPDQKVKVPHKPVNSMSSMKMQSQPTSEKSKADAHRAKRSADAMTHSTETRSDAPLLGPSPTKKARPSANASSSPPKDHSAEKGPTFTLPPLLSPTGLDVLESSGFSLPPMLSPTLPDLTKGESTNLRGGVRDARHRKEVPNGAAQSERGVISRIQAQEGSRTMSLEKNEFTASNSSDKDRLKPLQNNKRKEPKTPITNGVLASKPISNGIDTSVKKDEPKTSTAVPTLPKPEKKQLLVKIKIPKTIRKGCARILGMTPRPQKQTDQRADRPKITEGGNRGLNVTAQVNETGKDDQAKRSTSPWPDRKPKTADERSAALRITGKRRLPEEEGATLESTSKRHKHPQSLDLSSKPHTPFGPPIISPVLSHHGSASKAHLSTPKRTLKSTAMQRINSSEGEVKTPLGVIRGSTPIATSAPDRPNKEVRSVSALSNNPNAVGGDRLDALKAEQTKFAKLGRTLKHAIPQLLPDSDYRDDTPTNRQGAAIAVESLLTFILSFVLSDMLSRSRASSPEAASWRSLFGYIAHVKRVTQLYPLLEGLVHQLEGVCRDTITLYDSRTLERDAFHRKMMADKRSSTAILNPTSSPSAAEKAKEKADADFFSKLRDDFVDNVRMAQQAWQVGYSKLSVRQLERLFPETWAKGADSLGPGKGKDEFTVEKYMDGSYYLPLGPCSTGIEAVRAGWRMLEEWTAKEGVKWEGKMGL